MEEEEDEDFTAKKHANSFGIDLGIRKHHAITRSINVILLSSTTVGRETLLEVYFSFQQFSFEFVRSRCRISPCNQAGGNIVYDR